MSSTSPSDKPYKSRLFNFLNRQYINLNTQFSLKIRQLSYLASTGVQTLLYPIYLILKKFEKNSNNLHSSTENHRLNYNFSEAKIALPNCDQLIVDVQDIMTKHQTIKQLNPEQFESLACDVANHNLVFITKNHQIDNILNSQQQKELSVIIREIRGDYWQKNRLENPKKLRSTKIESIKSFLFDQWQKIKEDLSKLKYSNLTKHSSIATEELLVDKEIIYHKIPSNDHSFSLLELFDNSIAELENFDIFRYLSFNNNKLQKQPTDYKKNNNLVDESETKSHQKIFLLSLIQSAIDYFFGKQNQTNNLPLNADNDNLELTKKQNQVKLLLGSEKVDKINQQVSLLLEQSRIKTQELMPIIRNQTEQLIIRGLNQITTVQKSLANHPDNQENPFQIQSLISAGIDYFFSPNNQHNYLPSLQKKLNNLPFINDQEIIVINDETSETWLSWEDLFEENQNTKLLTDKSSNSVVKINISQENKKIINSQKKATKKVNQIPIKNQNKLKKITPVEEANNIILPTIKTEIIQEQRIEEIEAKVIEIKYEKHLLELILEKLDQFMLWLEETMIKTWQNLKLLMEKKD